MYYVVPPLSSYSGIKERGPQVCDAPSTDTFEYKRFMSKKGPCRMNDFVDLDSEFNSENAVIHRWIRKLDSPARLT